MNIQMRYIHLVVVVCAILHLFNVWMLISIFAAFCECVRALNFPNFWFVFAVFFAHQIVNIIIFRVFLGNALPHTHTHSHTCTSVFFFSRFSVYRFPFSHTYLNKHVIILISHSQSINVNVAYFESDENQGRLHSFSLHTLAHGSRATM